MENTRFRYFKTFKGAAIYYALSSIILYALSFYYLLNIEILSKDRRFGAILLHIITLLSTGLLYFYGFLDNYKYLVANNLMDESTVKHRYLVIFGIITITISVLIELYLLIGCARYKLFLKYMF